MAAQTVLLAEDDSSIRLVVSQALSAEGFAVRATASADALERWIREGQGDVVVTDVYLGEEQVFDRLSSLMLARPELAFIVMSAQNTILTAAAAADHGAFDYLPKPFDLDEMVATVRRALKTPGKPSALAPQVRQSADEAGLPLIGRSEAMQDVYRIISRVMNTDLTVMIEGEPGTGKDLAARAIHDLGRSAQGRFVQVDAASFTDGEALAGRLEGASTLYLDEVGDLSMDAQSRLSGLVRQLDGTRVIASTRASLPRLVEDGGFREDLYYRLSVVRLMMPPLRRRKEDIPELTRALLVRAGKQGLPSKTIEASAIDLLSAYDWPGNVRELENVILRLTALSPDSSISAGDVERELRNSSYADLPREGGLENEMEQLLKRHILADLMAGGNSAQEEEEASRVYQDVIERVERPLLSLALQVTSGNKVRAAALLGLNRNTLRAKINSLGIEDA
ncbi:MAG: response regulator [Alphaproteobacteria bacterium]|jgi:two-component system nitrogen regulation response regulator GlnG|nr:response regulator [Alphaproteobacteria bacterium]